MPLPLVILLAQAEPAPAQPEPAPAPELEPPPAGAVGFAVGIAHRLAPAGEEVPPALGGSITTLIGHRYALPFPWLALGAAGSFAYERHSSGDTGLSFFDFAALQTVVLELGRVRPWAVLGGGVTVGYFSSPEARYRPGESRAVLALVQAGLGVDVTVAGPTDATFRLEYAHALPRPTFDSTSGPLHLFGNRLVARLGVQYRF